VLSALNSAWRSEKAVSSVGHTNLQQAHTGKSRQVRAIWFMACPDSYRFKQSMGQMPCSHTNCVDFCQATQPSDSR